MLASNTPFIVSAIMLVTMIPRILQRLPAAAAYHKMWRVRHIFHARRVAIVGMIVAGDNKSQARPEHDGKEKLQESTIRSRIIQCPVRSVHDLRALSWKTSAARTSRVL